MRIVFPLIFTNTHSDKNTGVWGEEVVALACAKILRRAGHEVDILQFDDIKIKYDIAIFMNYTTIRLWKLKDYAYKNIFWIQGFNYDGDRVLSLDNVYLLLKDKFDVIISASRKLAEKYNIPFVFPPVDFEEYYPVEKTEGKDVVFIGNIIKPFDTNVKYLRPLCNFNYGLFGGDFGKICHRDWLQVVCSAKINIHFGFAEGLEWDMVTGRPLFVAASKGFLICDKIPWFMEVFKDAFVFTEGGEDLKEKISYYLVHEDERNEKVLKAYEIVKNLNFNRLSEIIGGK